MEPVLISGFCSVKWMRVLIIPPGWDTNLSQKEPGPCGQKAEILPTAPIKPALMVNIILSFFTAIYMQLKIKFKGDAWKKVQATTGLKPHTISEVLFSSGLRHTL